MLGSNGAGKTTAVRLLLGLSKPSGGMARIFGKDPRSRLSRTQIGAMLQVAKVPAMLTVREHLQLFSSYYPSPMSFREVIALAGLTGLENRKFGGLSGGQRQRVLFALAICGNPKLLFLDEPTVGLDVEARRSLWKVIREFVQRGAGVLLTTHYLEEADALSDRVVVIDRGRVIAEGTPAELKHRTSGRRIRCSSSISGDRIREMPGVLSVSRDGDSVVILTGDAERTVCELLRLDPALSGLEVTGKGLDDAFLSLIHQEVAQ